ncbi:MAG: hypothetical protein HYU63_08625 [Armatimonadetes bacterium]|nr:hypothetical protein [Armatimonadota bacterium]
MLNVIIKKNEITEDFAKKILEIYKVRVDKISLFMKEIFALLINFYQKEEKILEHLKILLSQTRNLRKKDFEEIIKDFWQRQNQKEKELEASLYSFIRSENEAVEYLKAVLNEKNFEDFDFQKFKREVFERQNQKEKELGKALRQFHLEIEEIYCGLRKLLEKGREIKIKDLKEFLNYINLQQKERDIQLGRIWDELWILREKINKEWQKVTFEEGK